MTGTVTLQQIETKLANGERFTLVEALAPEHYRRGHLPSAVNIPLDGFTERVRELLPERDSDIVVYCAGPTCGNSHAAKSKLQALGYSRVSVYPGGKSEWISAGKALEASHDAR